MRPSVQYWLTRRSDTPQRRDASRMEIYPFISPISHLRPDRIKLDTLYTNIGRKTIYAAVYQQKIGMVIPAYKHTSFHCWADSGLLPVRTCTRRHTKKAGVHRSKCTPDEILSLPTVSDFLFVLLLLCLPLLFLKQMFADGACFCFFMEQICYMPLAVIHHHQIVFLTVGILHSLCGLAFLLRANSPSCFIQLKGVKFSRLCLQFGVLFKGIVKLGGILGFACFQLFQPAIQSADFLTEAVIGSILWNSIRRSSTAFSERNSSKSSVISAIRLARSRCFKDILVLSVSAGRSTPYYYKADGVMEAYIRIGNESVIAPSYGFLAKRANGSVANSPYVNISREYMKQTNNIWYQIYQVVKENCTVELSGATPQDDVMERLLRVRRGI